MARSVAEIQQQIVDNLVTNFQGVGITLDPTQWSQYNILQAITFAIAAAIAVFEQLLDSFKTDIESKVASSPGASSLWIQSKMFQFQFSVNNPQVLELLSGIIQYPVTDSTLQIITACSVTSDISNKVTVKVAQGNPLAALTSDQISAAQGYINTIGVAGIQYNIVSLNPDQMMVDASIYYQGQYSSVIQQNVIDAINAFFANASKNNFDGSILMSDLENTIKAVQGVNDVQLNNVIARADATNFANGTYLIQNSQLIQRKWKTIAGYIISEQTISDTLSDTLKFVAE